MMADVTGIAFSLTFHEQEVNGLAAVVGVKQVVVARINDLHFSTSFFTLLIVTLIVPYRWRSS